MAEAAGRNRVAVQVQPKLLKFSLTWAEGERPSASAKLTNPADRPVGFAVQATDNFEVKPSRGIVAPKNTRIIYVTVLSRSPPVEQREWKITVFTFDVPRLNREEDIVFRREYYGPFLYLRDRAILRDAICELVIPVCWVDPETEIHTLMNKAVDEAVNRNWRSAAETLQEAIDLRADGFLLACRALVNHERGQKEGAQRDLQNAENLFAEAKETGKHFTSSAAYRSILKTVGVPVFTKEKLYGKQMIVHWSEAVTENQCTRLVVKVRFESSTMLRPDGDVELKVIVDSVEFQVEGAQSTDDYLDYFVQSLQVEVRPTGKWSKSFTEGFGLIKCCPGDEINTVTVHQGRSRGFTTGVNVAGSPCAILEWSSNETSGTTFPTHGIHKAKRDGDAYVFKYELRAFKDGSSAQNLHGRRFKELPKLPNDLQGGGNFNLGNFEGIWLVPHATAMDLRNEFQFTISLKAELAALWRSRKSSLKHVFCPPEPDTKVLEVEIRRTCVFAVARLRSFIENST